MKGHKNKKQRMKVKNLELNTLWGKAMEAWESIVSINGEHITEAYEGDDLFYNKPNTNDWANVEGGLYHINMAGWGETTGIQRKAMYNNLAKIELWW